MALLELSRGRVERAAAERAALAARFAAAPGDVHAQEELVRELARVQRWFDIGNTACLLALYGSVLTAQQVAAFAVGSWWAPRARARAAVVLLCRVCAGFGAGRAPAGSTRVPVWWGRPAAPASAPLTRTPPPRPSPSTPCARAGRML